MTQPREDLGHVRCSLRGNVPAGSWQTCRLTYTAGWIFSIGWRLITLFFGGTARRVLAILTWAASSVG